MYATSFLVFAILAQAPAGSPGAPSGKAHGGKAHAKGGATAPASDAGGYDTSAPPFEGAPQATQPTGTGASEAAGGPAITSPAAPKEPFVDPATVDPGTRAAAGAAAESEGAQRAAAPAEHQIDKSLVPVQPRSSVQNLASELLTAAIALPESNRIPGRPISLVNVLRTSTDRQVQSRATQEYWKLTEAVALYNFAWDEYEQLERLKPAAKPDTEPTPDEQVLLTRISAAKAKLHDAELAIVAAQYDLAATMKLRQDLPQPLPSDAPHVGPYRTLLTEIYQGQGRVPPPRAVLLDRTMPIRRSAVDARATAVQAAIDALDAAEEAYYAGRADLKLVLSLIEDLSVQRREFIIDVRVYNYEIAEYALAVPAPPGDVAGLAAMMIRPATIASANSSVLPASGATTGGAGVVDRAGLNAPIDQSGRTAPASNAGAQSGAAQSGAAQPEANRGAAGGPSRTPGAPSQKQGEPTLAPPRGAGEREPGKLPAGVVDEPPPPAAGYRGIPSDAASADEAAAQAPAAAEPPAAAEVDQPHGHSLYPALVKMPSDEQAKHLAAVLFWQPADATPDIAPIALNDYLLAVRPEGRKAALAAYWKSQQMAATRGALAAQVEQFDSLHEELQRSVATLDPAAPLLVRAGRSAAEADARRAEADCKAAQCDLALFMGRPVTGAWLAPATPPHAGGYRLRLEQLPSVMRESSDLQRLAATIARRPQAFCERAAALVGADKTRADDVTRAGGTLAGAERATESIRAQTGYTLAFAAELAEYNREMADYALLVLPASIPTPMLVQALVLTK